MPDKLDLIVDRLDDLREDVKSGFADVSIRMKSNEDAIAILKTNQDESKGERRVSGRMYNVLSTVVGGGIVATIDAFSSWFSNGSHH